MPITKLNNDLNIIQQLDDLPNDEGGLTAAQLKAKFDEAGNTIKTYINDTLTTELDTALSAKDTALNTHKTSGDHDGRYYTESEIDTKVNNLQTQITNDINALSTHKTSSDHDGRYYTESECDTKFETKDNITNNRKLSPTGDFTGTWFGKPFLEAEPTLSAAVADLQQKYEESQYSTPVETTSSIISLPSNTVKGQINVELKGQSVFQFVKNGNFADGTTGWIGVGANLSANNNILSITGDGTTPTPRTYQDLGFKGVSSVKYFIKAKLKVTNANANGLYLFLRDGAGGTVFTELKQLSPTQNTLYTVYGIVTLSTATTNNLYIMIDHRYADSATANGKVMEVQEVMAIDLDQHPQFDGMTADEINQAVPNWLPFGVNSTLCAIRKKSVGKNLFDKDNGWEYGSVSYDGNNWILVSASTAKRTKPIKCKPNTTYIISGGDKNIWLFQDINGNTVGGGNLASITSPSNAYKMIVYYSSNGTHGDSVQIEEGSTATEYEEYKESVSYIYATDENGEVIKLNSLMNGTKDELYEENGSYKVKKNTWEKVLQSSDITTLNTSLYTNLDVITISKPSDIVNADAGASQGKTILEGYGEYTGAVTTADIDKSENAHKHIYSKTYGDNIYLFVPKGTYPDLTAAQADLAGTSLIYQLAEPKYYELEGVTPLTAFENGTIIIEPYIRKQFEYNGGITLPYPASNIDAIYSIPYKTPVTGTLSADGTTITISGGNGIYEVHAPIRSEESTIPTTIYSVPLNRSAQIDGNTEMINQLSKELGDMWVTLLPLADKELAMYNIELLATETTTDLKNKINEILNVWK